MDKYDKEILSVLLENGKIQLSELSKKTNLSVSSCPVSYTHLTLPTIA